MQGLASETTETAKERAQESKDRAGCRVGEATEAAKHKASEVAESTKETGEAGKEKTGGFFPQVCRVFLLDSRWRSISVSHVKLNDRRGRK